MDMDGLLKKLRTVDAKTQKAKALIQLNKIKHFYEARNIGTLPSSNTFLVFTNQADLDLFVELGGIKIIRSYYSTAALFARPCPITPKHGFVESRVVNTNDELLQVWKETKEADSDGELILCTKISADFNAVLTPKTITIGPGHDGATSGKHAVVLPVIGDIVPEKIPTGPGANHIFKVGNFPGMCTGSGSTESHKYCCVCSYCDTPGCSYYMDHKTGKPVKDYLAEIFGVTNTPYIELVQSNQSVVTVTQLRDGPKIEATKDLIQRDTVVSEVIEVDESLIADPTALLQWDKLITSKQGIDGVVVYHSGGSPMSHFGVHCAIHGVPYVTTAKPLIGDKLTALQSNKIDFQLVREGFIIGLSKEYSSVLGSKLAYSTEYNHKVFKSILVSALYSLHGYSVLGKDESKLLGFAIAGLIRLATGACLGELRHYRAIVRREGKKDRGHIYKEYIIDIESGLDKLRFAYEIFQEGQWQGSFGGKNWANCTDLTIKLVNAVLRFHHRPNEKKFKKIIDQFNLLINAVHNGGLFLNKFADNSTFNIAAENNALFAAKNLKSLYQTATYLESCKLENARLSRQKLIANRLLKKDKEIVSVLLNETYCDRCREASDVCMCETCQNCGEISEECSCVIEQRVA